VRSAEALAARSDMLISATTLSPGHGGRTNDGGPVVAREMHLPQRDAISLESQQPRPRHDDRHHR
jgi:hypothetical protein